jgi:dihydropteroate synthase
LKLQWQNHVLDFSVKTGIMGVLNVTPDSFSDGGLFFNIQTAVEHALRMQDEGADIIDIGGESTRPGAERVDEKEEMKRIIPVIEKLASQLEIPISVDTYKSKVAGAALSAGASMVNDISGLRFDPGMPSVVAKFGVPVVIMHIKGTPDNMQSNPVYTALIPEIMDYLREGIEIARKAGIPEDMIIIDPGIGFGKTVEHNLQIIKHLSEFSGFEKPILLGPSRKSFIGKLLNDIPSDQRLEGTAAAVATGILNGANIVRVHEVRAMARVARVADGIKRGFQIL